MKAAMVDETRAPLPCSECNGAGEFVVACERAGCLADAYARRYGCEHVHEVPCPRCDGSKMDPCAYCGAYLVDGRLERRSALGAAVMALLPARLLPDFGAVAVPLHDPYGGKPDSACVGCVNEVVGTDVRRQFYRRR